MKSLAPPKIDSRATQTNNVSGMNSTQSAFNISSSNFGVTWRNTSQQGFLTSRAGEKQIKVENFFQSYRNWQHANDLLTNNKDFHDDVVSSLNEFQTAKFSSTIKDFKSNAKKMLDMPVIRVSRKKNNDNDVSEIK